MGGATTMMLSGDHPKNVVGYVEDCGYTSVYDIFSSELDKRFGLPRFRLLRYRYKRNTHEGANLSPCR